jgi:putative transposase
MKRKRFTEEQIITILKEHEAGSSVMDLARHHGVAENNKLKRLYADAMLDKQALREINAKKW